MFKGTYASLLWHPKWREKRRLILQRDGRRCRHCGATAGLQVHHRQYHTCKRTGHKLAPWCYADHLLITLCDRCHTDGHRRFQVPSFNR